MAVLTRGTTVAGQAKQRRRRVLLTKAPLGQLPVGVEPVLEEYEKKIVRRLRKKAGKPS